MGESEVRRRLHGQLAAMVAFERTIEQRGRACHGAVGNVPAPEVLALLDRVMNLAGTQERVLAARLRTVAPEVPVPDAVAPVSVLEQMSEKHRYLASGALLAVHALVDQAVLGYAVLLELSFRAADSDVRGGENTGDIAFEHMRSYAAAAQEIVRALPYVVVDELEADGSECDCSCPACGLGVCACAAATRRRVGMAWADAGSPEVLPGITLVRPRTDSPAARAGLAKGDFVLAVDGRTIDFLPLLQETIRSHGSRETVLFAAQGADGERREVPVVRL